MSSTSSLSADFTVGPPAPILDRTGVAFVEAPFNRAGAGLLASVTLPDTEAFAIPNLEGVYTAVVGRFSPDEGPLDFIPLPDFEPSLLSALELELRYAAV
jgi:hypothetical protein